MLPNRFRTLWGEKYSTIATLWQRYWMQVIPFPQFPPEMRKIIYTRAAENSIALRFQTVPLC